MEIKNKVSQIGDQTNTWSKKKNYSEQHINPLIGDDLCEFIDKTRDEAREALRQFVRSSSSSLGNFPPLCSPVRVSPNPKDPSNSSGALMEGLLPPGSIPEDLRVSVRSDRNVAYELLDGDLRKTYSHLQFECSDDSVARLIKTLTTENLVLRQKAEDSFSRVLLDSNSSSLSSVPVGKPPSPTSWKDIVAPVNPLISRMNLHYCPLAVVNNDLHVNIPESVASG